MRLLLSLFIALTLLTVSGARAQYDTNNRQGAVEGTPDGIDPESPTTGLLPPDTELIDVPTAAVLDLGGFYSRTRFFNAGGVLEWLNFGIYPRVNLGVSLHVDRLVGVNSPIQLTRPELQLKMRFFDGDRILPALVLGFDGQGYFYNRPRKRYNQKQRGLYLMGSQEIGVPGLQLHAGMNISDFDSNSIFGILATSLNVRDKFKLMMEWDNINDFVDSRLNMGIRFYISPFFNFDFAVRGIGQGGTFDNGISRSAERVVQFKYVGHF